MKTTTLLIGALLLGGGFYLYQKSKASAPSLDARVNAALATETNPFVLTALAAECDKAGRTDLSQLLKAKAQLIFASTHQMPTSGPGGTEPHPATAPLEVAVASTVSMLAPVTLSLAQATLSGGASSAPKPDYTFKPTSPMW
jgi:hypothetical protein